MDDLDRLKFLLSGRHRPDLTYLEDSISKIFDTESFKLKASQKKALAIITRFRRGFFNKGVGEGKTLDSLLGVAVARASRCLLFVPANLVNKTIKVAIPQIEEEFNIYLDWVSIHGMTQKARRDAMNKHRLTIFPYSLLSVEDTEELLELSNADLIICDECHSLKDKDSAKTGRFLRYLDKYPDCDLVCMSATSIQTSLFDYHHLITRALKHLSPLPHNLGLVYEIQEALAYDGFRNIAHCKFLSELEPSLRVSYGENLINVSKSREFMKTLFKSSPATVLTENQSVACSIYIEVVDLKCPTELLDTIKEIEKTWCTPNGDELEDILAIHSLLTQISAGFYYRLYWPKDTLDWVIENWKLRNKFVNFSRKWISNRYRKGLDTPGLVEKALERNEINSPELKLIYNEWKDSCKGVILDRIRERIWISDYKIQETKRLAKKLKNVIIWYHWDEVGQKLKEAMPEATFCPAGADISLLNKMGILICSLAHSEGQNLQHHCNSIIYDMPYSGDVMEQLIGRTHRDGQKADVVSIYILVANDIDKNDLKKVYLQSKYLHEINQDKKFIIADWSTDEYKFDKKRASSIDNSIFELVSDKL